MGPAVRIALVSEHASPLAAIGGVDAGGQNVHVAELAAGLVRHGHSVAVYTRRDNAELAGCVDTGTGRIRRPAKRASEPLSWRSTIAREPIGCSSVPLIGNELSGHVKIPTASCAQAGHDCTGGFATLEAKRGRYKESCRVKAADCRSGLH